MAEKWLVLDALGGDGRSGDTVRLALQEEAATQGKELDMVCLTDAGVQPCRGCFGCWTQTPGLCRIKDDVPALTARFVAAQKVILVTPIVFGGYAANLKIYFERVVLPALLPFFQQVSGRTRHLYRYDTPPELVAIGWLPKPDAAGAQVFAGVVARNAANMLCRRHACCVVSAEDDAGHLRGAVRRSLASGAKTPDASGKTIMVLCGSPKKKGSASQALGDYVANLAAGKGARVETASLALAHADAEAFEELAHRLDAADGVCLTYPLYADQLPGHVLAVLARLAARRKEIPPIKPQRLFAVANCGFPEACNNDVSLEMCRLFAAKASFAWMGGCAIGGGGMYEGHGPQGLGWFGRKACRALARKTELLLSPQEPDLMDAGILAVPCPLPSWLYLLFAKRGWKKALGAGKDGRSGYERPFDPREKRA